MAEDQYDFDDDNLSLSADPDSHEMSAPAAPVMKKGGSKRTLLLLVVFLLIAGGGGGFWAYQNFLAEPEMPAPLPVPANPVANNVPAPANNLPPQVTPAPGQLTPVDPTAPQANVTPAAPSTGLPAPVTPPTDPNAVVANALPAPPVSPETAANPADPNKPAVVPEPVPAEAAKAINNDLNAAKPEEKPASPAAAKSEQAASGTLEDKKADAKKEAEAKPSKEKEVIKSPSEDQLKPVDPKEDAVKEDADAKPAATGVEKRTADTIAAVNEILGKELPKSSGNSVVDKTMAKAMGGKAPEKNAPPQEVTSHAQEVIKVKKVYSAQSPQAINAAGDRVLEAKQYDAAIQLYDQQLRSNPSDPSALSGKALALQQAGRDTEAMDIYQHLTELNPRDVEALTNYLGLLQKQKPEEAMTRLNSLAEQYPDNAAVSGQIASVFASQMDTPNALRYFMKARALDASNPAYPFNIAVLYDRMGTSDKANQYYHLALSTAESYPENESSIPAEAIRNRLRNIGN